MGLSEREMCLMEIPTRGIRSRYYDSVSVVGVVGWKMGWGGTTNNNYNVMTNRKNEGSWKV